MKFSICIPHYNRIEYLLKSLEFILKQSHQNYEIIISDDCSTDHTQEILRNYNYPENISFILHKFSENVGYDRNLRKTLELATGDYCIILGNDDTLAHKDVLIDLEKYILSNNHPDIGFCNYADYENRNNIIYRALKSTILGTGAEIGMSHYSCFSFVAGIMIKKTTFDRFNTDIYDGSIYSQIALALHMICNNAILFSIDKVWVLKDITINEGIKSNSYKDHLNKSWKKIYPIDGGLKSVISVLVRVLQLNNKLNQKRIKYIFDKILLNTYPYWVIDYRYNNATPSALGLFLGLQPWKINEYHRLNTVFKFRIILYFYIISFISFTIPVNIFFKYKEKIYRWVKKQ